MVIVTKHLKHACLCTVVLIKLDYKNLRKLHGFGIQSYSTEGNSTKTAYYDKPIYESEDLEVSINRSREGFLLNTNRSTWDIIDDLYNTYKRVRYKEHFEK